MSLNTDGKKQIDDTIEWYKKETARLQSEVDHLTHLLSGQPDFAHTGCEEFQRVWEACIKLSDKAGFKVMFELMHKMEKELGRLRWALACHHWHSDCQCVLMGVTPPEDTKKPEAP